MSSGQADTATLVSDIPTRTPPKSARKPPVVVGTAAEVLKVTSTAGSASGRMGRPGAGLIVFSTANLRSYIPRQLGRMAR